jgi:EthD domain
MFRPVSTTAPDDVRARVVLVLAATARDGDGRPSAAFEAAIRRTGAMLRARVGAPSGERSSERGLVRVGVRLPDDPLSQTMGGDRGELEPVHGVIEITAPEGVTTTAAAALVDGARDSLGEHVDPERSAVVAGRCYRFLSAEDAPLFLAILGYRDPAITMEQLTQWWLHQHGPLALSIVDPLPLAYEQLHADQDASHAASEAAGLPAPGYDMYDTIAIDSLESLMGSTMNPEVAAQLFEDEVGHVDHSRMRGAIQRTVLG